MRRDLLEGERVGSIVGAFYAVYNYYGYGFSEGVYAGALEIELRQRGHEVVRELAVAVSYKGVRVAWQRLDMVVDDAVIVVLPLHRLPQTPIGVDSRFFVQFVFGSLKPWSSVGPLITRA
jgi:hypothetical protein